MLLRVTDPLIEPFRRIMPNTGMIDMSPMMAIIGLLALQTLLGLLVEPA